jgi:hypothetical protein
VGTKNKWRELSRLEHQMPEKEVFRDYTVIVDDVVKGEELGEKEAWASFFASIRQDRRVRLLRNGRPLAQMGDRP